MKNPNFVFIICDDLRFNSFGALGNSEIHTPNLDKLIQSGTSFNEAHIPGASCGAVCMPSRAMIHTSKRPADLEELGAKIPANHSLLGEYLKSKGYDTFGIGKWHNGENGYARSFTDGGDIFFGGMWDHWNVPTHSFDKTGEYDNWKQFTRDPYSTNRKKMLNTNQIKQGRHSTDLFTDTTIAFIEEKVAKEKPFFLYTAYMAPHDPRTMPEEYKNMYDPEKITLPENFETEHFFDFGVRDERDEVLESYPRNPLKVKQHIADYYAMITHLDDNFGRIVAALKDKDVYENTIFIFTADHGLSIGQHGLMGKQNLYEHSTKVPLFISGPGIPQGSNEEFVYLMDIFPTICDLLDSPAPIDLKGESLLPILSGTGKGHDHLYAGFLDKIRSYRDEAGYKLIEYRYDGKKATQLFNLTTDPLEMKNLADSACYKDILTKLQKKLFVEATEWGDLAFDQGKAFWKQY